MREKIGPWLPALNCAALAIIVTVGNIWSAFYAGSADAGTGTFIIFMPMCFFFVGIYLTKLSTENSVLRERLDDLTEKVTAM